VIGVYLTALKLIWGAQIGGRPLLFLGVLLIVVGSVYRHGAAGEMLVRIYHESQRKPIYMVRRVDGRPERPA